MAQQDTGMGWSAKQEWLKSNTGVIGVITPPAQLTNEFPVLSDYTIPGIQTVAIGYGQYYNSGTDQIYGIIYRAGAWADNDEAKTPAITGDHLYFISNAFFSAPSGTNYYLCDQNGSSHMNGALATGKSATQDSVTGLYYLDFAGIRLSGDPDPTSGTIAVFDTLREMLDAFAADPVSVGKLNSGYAVTCGASWYTPAGTHLLSPVLISTDPLATVITTNGSTPDETQTSLNFLYDGVRFYMSLLPGYDADRSRAFWSVETAPLEQFAAAAPSKVFTLIASETFSNIIIGVSPDPYNEEGGTTGAEGGDGDSDPEDDPVEEETLPIPAVSGLGFSTIYVPTAYDLYTLASYLWSGNLDLDNFLRLFANPMDSILGLSAVPVPLSGTYEPIYLGGQLLQGVTMPRYSGRTAVKVDMGSTTISERWGSYLDYDPYTEFSVYLPFIGIKNIKADDIMGKTVSLMYNIDILSGACVAYLRTSGGSVLYEWAGQCAMQIPITGSNWDNIFSTAISTAVTLGGAMVAPASAPMLAGSVASAAVQAVAAKPRVERSGAVTGVTGFLGQLRPYIIRTIPEAYIPDDQNKYIGYPSYMSVNLGSLTGYNEVASIHLENVPATGDELSELESILKGGVIF